MTERKSIKEIRVKGSSSEYDPNTKEVLGKKLQSCYQILDTGCKADSSESKYTARTTGLNLGPKESHSFLSD